MGIFLSYESFNEGEILIEKTAMSLLMGFLISLSILSLNKAFKFRRENGIQDRSYIRGFSLRDKHKREIENELR